MREILLRLTNHELLSREEARNVLTGIGKGEYNTSEIASFLTVFMMRFVSVDELAGFRDALLDLCLRTDLSDFNTIDLCGTGGDGKNTFNISTLSSLVVAGTGAKVAKHGNYGVSSAVGSSNVIEHFGYKFTNDRDILLRQIDRTGICFLHAPLFHPAMKYVAPIRKDLGLKTFFNMLGPMVNPSFPQNQSVGVFNLETARLYNYIFQETNKNYTVIYSLDGYDEISLTGNFKLIKNGGEYLLAPEDFSFEKVVEKDLHGGDTIEEAADIFLSVLEGNGTPTQNDVVFANSAVALNCIYPEKSIGECIEMAKRSIFDGDALKVLKQVCEIA